MSGPFSSVRLYTIDAAGTPPPELRTTLRKGSTQKWVCITRLEVLTRKHPFATRVVVFSELRTGRTA